MATVRTFDTLGYAKSLASKGVDAKVAEALAEANHEYLINDLATKDFVHSEIKEAENSLLKAMGKMIAVATGIILAGIPLIQATANVKIEQERDSKIALLLYFHVGGCLNIRIWCQV